MERIDKIEKPDRPVRASRAPSRFDMILDSVRRLLRRGAISHLERMVNKMHPADVANVLHHLYTSQEKRTVFELVKVEGNKAQVLTEIATLIQNLPDDDQAYILTTLPDERAQEVLRLMKPEESAEVKDLLKYEPQTAGAIMTGEYFALPANTTVQEAIRKLQSTDIGNIFYVYVTDKEEKLIGVLSLRQLLGSPDRTLGSMITKEVISVTPETDQEEVAKQ